MLTGGTALLASAAAFAKPGPLPWRNGPRPTPTPGDDAELLALVGSFQQLDAEVQRLNAAAGVITDETWDAVQGQWWAVAGRIEQMVAMTAAGVAAKASLLMPIVRDTAGLEEASAGERFALSVARDMGAAAPMQAAAQSSDAKLLAAFATLQRHHDLIEAIVAEESAGSGITPESKDQEARLTAALDDWHVTANEIADIPARTAAGLRAKAEAVRQTMLRHICINVGDTLDAVEGEDLEVRIGWSLARDVLGRTAT
jgi:hypothetical protein